LPRGYYYPVGAVRVLVLTQTRRAIGPLIWPAIAKRWPCGERTSSPRRPTCARLVHFEGDGLPGGVSTYNSLAVLKL